MIANEINAGMNWYRVSADSLLSMDDSISLKEFLKNNPVETVIDLEENELKI